MDARVEQLLESLNAGNMNEHFSSVSWEAVLAFIDCAYRQRVEDRDVVSRLDVRNPGAVDCEQVGVAIEEMGWFFLPSDITDDTLLKLGCFMGLIRDMYGEKDWHSGYMKKVRAALVRLPSVYVFEMTPEEARDEKMLFHLSSIAEMDQGVPLDFIRELGASNTSSAVVTLWRNGVPAAYVNEFKDIVAPKRKFISTISSSKMLAEAMEAGASAEYLGRGLLMKLLPEQVIRAAQDGMAFEYLAAYYENETV